VAKSIWKGEISFGLVSIPVSLVTTEEKNDLRFHLINAKTKSRIRYIRVDEETGDEVPWEQIIKGYEYDKGDYIFVNEEDFEKASPELFKSIDIEEFVNLKDIDNLYYIKPYYLVPEGKNKKAYVLLRETLKKTNKVGVAKIILRTSEHLSLILPHENTLLVYLIHFSDDIRSEEELNVPMGNMKSYKISDKEIAMAVDLIKSMSVEWQPKKYHNVYRETLNKWLDKQIKISKSGKKGKKLVSESEGVIDFISLLKESMKAKQIKAKKGQDAMKRSKL
jgi:DNA end-binding protein Ku